MDDRLRRIYAQVARVPRGRVATYGQIAALAGLPRRARMVGAALAGLPDDSIPWHRVVNAQGRISRRGHPGSERLQRERLEEEGVRFVAGRIPLARFQWKRRRSVRSAPQRLHL